MKREKVWVRNQRASPRVGRTSVGGILAAALMIGIALAAGRGGTGQFGAPASFSPFESPTDAPASDSPFPSEEVVDNGLAPLAVTTASKDPWALYDVSEDGSWLAYRDTTNGPGPLHLRGKDGSQADLDVGPTEWYSPQAAVFSPDGTVLAVSDGGGSLWTIELPSMNATLVANSGLGDLVFGRNLRYGDATHLYVNLVGSAEVPIPPSPRRWT